MTKAIIEVQNVCKRYRLGQFNARTLREEAARWFRRRRSNGKADGLTDTQSDDSEFWALKDISFSIQQGEIVGIIGGNGAGKSTLLKIMSRVTEPTTGEIRIRGRVASLLEVGTGFHPELTGRENVYLNGSILGMSRAEITAKFDEILAFAEVERFVDTPVKRYSSGMYVRLAFAVAAHLDPDILVLDEVLAVGDAAFQKKCLDKLGNVAGEGRTILFVSHNHQVVRTLCSRGILISEGRVITDGPTDHALETYKQIRKSIGFDQGTEVTNAQVRRGSGAVRFSAIKLMDQQGRERSSFLVRETVRFEMHYNVRDTVRRLYVSIALYAGYPKTMVTSIYRTVSETPLEANECGCIEIELPKLNLRPGDYALYFWLGGSTSEPYDVVDDIIPPISVETPRDSLGRLDYDPGDPVGYFDLPANVRCWKKAPSITTAS